MLRCCYCCSSCSLFWLFIGTSLSMLVIGLFYACFEWVFATDHLGSCFSLVTCQYFCFSFHLVTTVVALVPSQLYALSFTTWNGWKSTSDLVSGHMLTIWFVVHCCTHYRCRLLKTCSFFFPSYPPILTISSFIPTSSPVMAMALEEYLSSSSVSGWVLASKRHLVPFLLKKVLFMRAITLAFASSHKTQAFQWRCRFCLVLSIHITFTMVAPKHPQSPHSKQHSVSEGMWEMGTRGVRTNSPSLPPDSCS